MYKFNEFNKILAPEKPIFTENLQKLWYEFWGENTQFVATYFVPRDGCLKNSVHFLKHKHKRKKFINKPITN